MQIETWAQTPFQVIWSAILIQNANSNNAGAAAVDLLAATNNDPQVIRQLTIEQLATIIQRAGLYKTKAGYIKAAADWLATYQDDPQKIEQLSREQLQNQLLAVKGIGNETADDILLYGFRKPVFIVDAYAKRQFKWLGLTMPTKYRPFQKVVENDWQLNWQQAQELHALIDTFGKQIKNQLQWNESFMGDFKLTE
ncbi:hypothetical protein AYR55_09715 [Loigolactobacillus backii]|nr:endonuclease III [Loigolactobacillus backii]ANK67939.1 hypothetical protein AYR55_09715 [Loigolactobacillus backii]